MEILMSKDPSYVRCIKPNDAKQAGEFPDLDWCVCVCVLRVWKVPQFCGLVMNSTAMWWKF